MSEKKEIDVFHPTENLVVTDTVAVGKSVKKDFLLFNGLAQVPAFAVGTLFAMLPYVEILEGGLTAVCIVLPSTLFATFMTRHNFKGDKVYKKLGLKKFSTFNDNVAVGKMKNGTRLQLDSFPIREVSDIEIKEFKTNTEKVDESQATHTITHYVVKDKQGFRMEQESIPNHEAIWDASADALVEVHQVNETQKRYIFQPVF